MQILLIGKNGQVGWELQNALQSYTQLLAVGRQELDILNARKADKLIYTIRPEIIINATGYNDVDGAEKNRDITTAINVTANASLAQAAAKVEALYITYSSDYVFDGSTQTPYTELDPLNPINFYGKSKMQGEIAVKKSGAQFLILRTSSVYSLRRPCFVTKIIESAHRSTQLKVRSDLVSSPTSARFLAEATAHIIKNLEYDIGKLSGLFHIASFDYASRFEWAKAINNELGLNLNIYPTIGDESSGAKRPSFSALDSDNFVRTFNFAIPTWNKMLSQSLREHV